MRETKAVAYYRVSTAGQGRSGLGLEAQRSAVIRLAGSRAYRLLAEFTEVESGKRNDRPQLTRALHHAKVTGAVLVIAKLDRLSRNAGFLLTLRDSGVRFLAADLPDANDLTIGVLAVVAQGEREAISRRTKEALAVIRRRIAADGCYSSPRSGRVIERLGNPQGTAALRRGQAGNAAAVSGAKRSADDHARDIRPILEGLRARGVQSYAALATALNGQGVVTRRGGKWHPITVHNMFKRLQQHDLWSSIS
jgi:hypothetical protein